MRRNLAILVILLVLALLAGCLLQYQYLSYLDRAAAETAAPAPTYAAIELPRVERLRSPHAILLLDASASMRDSDPKHLQSEAVAQFYSVFRDLSKEILAKDDRARVAVVLFASIAQVIDWTGQSDPWLDATDANTLIFADTIARALGREGSEPRTGQETDYLAALEEAHRLADRLPSPPAVLFMTDGANDPHPFLSPAIAGADREKALSRLPADSRQRAQAVAGGSLRWLPSGGTVFDSRQLRLPRARMSANQLADARTRIAASLSDLLARRYPAPKTPAAPPFWAPVLLGSAGQTGGDDVRSLLSVAPPGGQPRWMECRDARELPGFYVGALSAWLALTEIELAAGAREFQLPAGTHAFAASLETRPPGSRLALAGPSGRLDLAGRDGLWAGVASGGGLWRFEGDAGPLARGKLFVYPRYEWVLSVPKRASIAEERDRLEVRLYLYSIETGQPVKASEVYSHLPVRLPLTFTVAGQEQIIELLPSAEIPAGPVYQTSISLPPGGPRTARVEADLRPLRSAGILALQTSLAQTAEIRPSLRLDIRNPRGVRVTPGIANVPREADAVRDAVDRWRRLGR